MHVRSELRWVAWFLGSEQCPCGMSLVLTALFRKCSIKLPGKSYSQILWSWGLLRLWTQSKGRILGGGVLKSLSRTENRV